MLAHTVDVTDTEAMDEFAEAVHARFDTVDLLINNAGIGVWPDSSTPHPKTGTASSRST